MAWCGVVVRVLGVDVGVVVVVVVLVVLVMQFGWIMSV
jgi:hypothetical protein